MPDFNDEPIDEQELRRLWASVIIQALIDATQENPKLPSANIHKLRAHTWLTVEAGVTAKDFEAVCGAANLDPATVRNFYRNYEGPPLTMHTLVRIRNERFPKELYEVIEA